MRVHERASLFSVAGKTGVVHGVAPGQFVTIGSVHIVTIGASHLALGNRMMRRPIDLVAQVFVARITRFRLIGSAAKHLVTAGMNLMAVITRNVSRLVLATHPKGALGIPVVTGLAHPTALS